jgi:hypothetical protein
MVSGFLLSVGMMASFSSELAHLQWPLREHA